MALDDVNQGGETAFIVDVVFLTLAIVATCLRLLTRNLIKLSLQADDWFIVAALIMLSVTSGLEIWGIIVGKGGQDLSSPITDYHEIEGYLKAIFIQGSFYYACLTFVRLSITSFYRRIFTVPYFRKIAFVVDGFSAVYFILGFLLNIFGCTPVSHLWDQESKGSCLKNFNTFILVNETFGIILDACILALPVRMIVTLQMATRTKLLLSGTFLLGGFVIVTNIVRLIFIHSNSGQFTNFTSVNLWSSIHSSTAIVCASLPTYRPLLPRIAGLFRTLRTKYSSLLHTRPSFNTNTTSIARSPDANTVKAPYAEILDGPSWQGHCAAVEGSIDSTESGFPLNAIGVKRTVDIV